jgi:Dyp-type peroxidase family
MASDAAPVQSDPTWPDGAGPPLDLSQIQGNVLAGFNKDHQTLIFLRFPEGTESRDWLDAVVDDIATTAEVKQFNDLFREMHDRRRSRERGERQILQAVWTNVAFTASGLGRLGVGDADAASMSEAFHAGMAARAGIIGDQGANEPATWRFGASKGQIDAVLIVAADNEHDLHDEVAHHHRQLARHGVGIVFEQEGQTRSDNPGHEHFGFKDGISQPGIRGFTPQTGADPDQGDPGQDLVWPGEFVLGYPMQTPALAAPGGYGDPQVEPHQEPSNPAPVPAGTLALPWMINGSYLVIRRLTQDVAAFRAFVGEQAAAQVPPMEPGRLGAKLVGRWESGAPLEPQGDDPAPPDVPATDPSIADPTLLAADHINNFDFNDADGQLVPLAAHIRKVYPRNEATKLGGEADAERRRLLRRGIPFGLSYRGGAVPDSPHGAKAKYPHDRGLVFACYQADIEQQFEFVQQHWVNEPSFPDAASGDTRPAAGQDPVIAQQDAERTFSLPGGNPAVLNPIAQWVTTTGGEYFFAPGLAALEHFAGRA